MLYATTDEDRVDKVTKRKLRGRRLERTTTERESRVLKKLFVFISAKRVFTIYSIYLTQVGRGTCNLV